MTWLDELQEKAEKATQTVGLIDEWKSTCGYIALNADGSSWRCVGPVTNMKGAIADYEFISAANPETVKRLIRIARAAMAFINPYPDLVAEGESLDEARDLELALKDDLEEALREGGLG